MIAMSAATYNEVFNTITQPDGTIVPETSKKDPMFHWDNHFPERISRMSITPEFAPPPMMHTGGGGSGTRRAAMKNRRNRCAARFKTQPITFDEIKEVDEETTPTKIEDTKETLKTQFSVFSRSMDGLVVSPFSKKGEAAGGPNLHPSPLAAGATTTTTSEESEADKSEADEKQLAANKTAHAQSAALQRQQFRQRRKKRHTKSIEEAPELDRIENFDT